MRILMTGKNGQLGFELQRALAPLGEVVAVGTDDCNLADGAALRELIQKVHPDVIVNAAAYTAVDKAETDQDMAHAVNAQAPGILGEEAAKLGASVIHFSTDYVFDGEKAGSYTETDPTNPQSAYGRTKLQGEQGLAEATPHHLILRTSWVVGAHGGNFAKTMLRLAAERDELKVVADQFGAPTSAALLADVTAHLVRQLAREGAEKFPYGLYHLTAGGDTSWHAYAQFVIDHALKMGKPLKTRPERVLPIPAASYPTPAKRPHNSRMDTTRFQTAFSLVLPDWRLGVGHILQTIL
ncbi:dTDP-4-dehydrorhamnose reductase [Hydrogenophaga sp. PAMC20947]|uniref:dTDP-4-dehydrorhamnose reductase n=1 Tax=Hydrogenophaga sp. PAMC20947 TaxID=2565558 RepID=UPI001FFAAD76|nr:dTDP-4-dehydrorhamnose reductase [Hydrogenophaga sp. PAMC20947]